MGSIRFYTSSNGDQQGLYDHEGYVLAELTNGEWTGTSSPETRAIGATSSHRAGCECGWRGVIHNTGCKDLWLSGDTEDLFMADWEAHAEGQITLMARSAAVADLMGAHERVETAVAAA